MGNQIINITVNGSSNKKEKSKQKPTYNVDGWEVKGLEKGLSQTHVELLVKPLIKRLESNK